MGSEFYISGYVLDHNTSTGLEGVTVRLFQNVMQDKNHYGTAISNVAGNFRLVVPTTLLQAGRLSIEFYSDGQRLHVDQGVEEWDPANPPLDHVFRLLPPQVPERPEDPQFGPVGPGQYYVQGLIKYTDGTPLPSSVTVRAYDRKLENTVFFTGNLGAQGDYHVEFPTQTAPKHIFVEVLDGSTVISASRILCDPFVSAQTARIDITITADPYRRFRQPVEYDRLAAALPNMPAGSDLMSMNRDDIILLGCDEKFPLDMIRAYVLSHQIDQVLSLDQKEALYGLMRQGLPTTPHVLAALPKSVLRNALERAAAADQISQSIVTNADVGILDDLRNSTVDFMRDLNSSDSIGNVLLKGSSRMQSAGDKLSGSELTRFAESWLDSVDKNETASQFWERVSASTLFNDDETQMAKRAVRYGNLMLNNTTLMQRFDLAYSGTTPSTAVPVSKTVELSVADWVALIDPAPQGSDVALPTGWTFEGDSVTAYAELLFQHAERAFASEKTVFALKQAETSDVEVFLTNNPEFHFLQTNVSTFLTAPSTNTTGLDVPSLQARLEKLQRLYRVTPIQDRYAAIAALESGGMTSAMSIARLGRKAFIDQFAPSLGADGNNRAGEIYQSAQKMVAMSTALVLQSHEGFTRSGFTGGPGYIDGDFDAIAINMNANHQNVFSERLCECDVCGSILSPAAYFVDLQQWMEYQDPNQNVVQLLHERRPDLGDLKLHCENALRVLPYIDLVNEQLEVAVIKEKALLDGQMSTASVPVETTWTEAQLLAQPEHPQPLAYDILKSAYWPHRLPFHAELESVRAYLDLFDIDHAAFVETLTLPGTAEDGRYSLFLGVNLAEEGLMTNASPTSSPSARELWGYPMMPSNVSHPVAISDSVSWTVALQYVPEFMKRAGLESYDTLLDVVHTRYLNRDGYFQIVVATDANGCDVREQYFNQAYTSGGTHTFPGSADFTRAHGFLRLMKRTGWSPLKLDKALHALSDGTGITRAVLQRVVAAYRLQRQLGVDLTPMLSWWSLMDTYSDRNSKDHPEPSLYHRVFFEMMQVYASGQLFALDASTTTPIELMSPSSEGLIDNYGADLIGAFNTTMEALSTAEKQVVDELSPSAVTRLERNLQHIWLLYRRVHLANTAKLTLEEMKWFSDATTIHPLTPVGSTPSPEQTLEWFERLERFRAMGFSVEQLSWLLSSTPKARQNLAPRSSDVQASLGRLRDAISNVEDAVQHPGLVQKQLAVDFNLTSEVMGALESLVFTSLGNQTITAVLTDSAFVNSGSTSEVNDADPWADLVDDGSAPAIGLAFNAYELLAKIVNLLVTLGVDAEGLRLWVNSQAPLALLDLTTLPLSEDLTAVATRTEQLWNTARLFTAGARMPGQSPSVVELVTAAQQGSASEVYAGFAQRIDRPEHDIRDLIAHFFGAVDVRVMLSSFDPAQRTYSLSIDGGDAISATKASDWASAPEMWAALKTAIDVAMGGSPVVSVSYIDAEGGGVSGANAAGLLLSPVGDYHAEVSSTDFNRLWDIYDVERLEKLFDAIGYLTRVPVSATELIRWRTLDPDASVSEAVRSAAQVGSDTPEDWASISKPAQDHIRIAKRDASTAWLLGHIPYKYGSIADLHGYYLIDPAMSPCMKTTRLKQAISSVQLFIFRVMAGLEDHLQMGPIRFGEEAAEAWAWRKSYRVWEAARKVFLYPENWIEPELRKNKTTFFERFESEVLESEFTEEGMENAFLNYLEEVHNVSNLRIIGMYHEYSAGEKDVLHLFGQTRSTPKRNWYRRREDGLWTPWEEVPLDLPKPQAAPVIFADRLILFWMEARKEKDKDNSYWKVNLAWSEYQDGIWSPKRISEVSLDVKIFSVRIVQDTYFYLKTKTLHSGLYVHVFTRSNFKGTWERFRGSFWLNPCTGGAEVISADNEKTLSQEQPGPGSNYIDMSYFYQGYRITQADFASIPWAMVETGKDYIDGVTPSVRVKNLVKPITISLIDEPNPPPRSVVIMTPNQYTGFVSQSPFIVQEPEHTYLAYDMFAWRDTGILDVYFGDSPSLLGKSTLMAKDGISEEVMPISSPASLSGPGSLQRFMGTNDEEQAEVYGARLDADFRGVNQLVEDPTGFASQNVKYRFETLHHHYICDILREARFHGVMGVLSPDPDGAGAHLIRQAASNDSYLSSVYFIEDVIPSSPRHDIDFDYHGPQGAYNWEIFFHVPYYIACRLSGEQQFEEAMRWFHTIFDPRRGTEEAWRVKPLVESSQFAIDAWKSLVDGNGDEETRTRFVRQVQAWEKDPFDPHAIAQLRPLAYKRSVLMKYLDTILAWGDERFTQDTMESLNEATQLYLYAFSILGERSVSVTHHPTERDTAKTFDNIAGDTTTYTEIAFSTELDFPSVFSEFSLPISHLGDFCVPRNAAFEKYWDIIEDRLYKIRHCLNIQGVRRTLPIFEPEIDPAELIRASAFGADLDSVVGNDDVLPVYRFSTMLQTAKGLAGSVRAFSSALLSALEKKDAEEIARLRSQHEVELLEMVRDTRQQQVEEAERSLAAAERSKAMAVYREAYYAELLEEKLLPAEKKEENQREKAVRFQKKSSNRQLAASVFRALPTFGVGAVPEFFYGGQHIGGALDFLAAASSRQALEHSTKADRNARRAGRQRREQEWNFQVELAKREQAQLEQSIQAAQKRVEIAQRELSNHDKQIAQRREVDDWMRSKFTSQELYAWMVGQLSALHSQSYQLAIEIARKAERCYRHELGIDVEASGADSFTPFVKPGRWDSLRKGLMAGEWLQHELDRMEVAYLDNNIREYELTKHISLSRLDPFALALLRENGECWIEIPEVLFDLDCPGQYFRRISSVAVTVACVSGAQRHINVELELTSAKIRTSASGSLVSDKIVGTNKIVTSAAIEDPGMFSADGGDGRFRPFERRGAVSTWHIRIANQTLPQFDWNSISDVTMHMRYTARDGGDSFRDEVSNGVGGVGGLKEALDGFTKGITAVDASGQPTGSLSSDILAEVCATRDAPDAWHMAQTDTVLSIPFGEERRPYFAVNQAISIKAVYLIVKADDITSVNMSLVEGMSDAMSLVYSTPDSSVDVWKVDKTSTSWPESVALTLSSGNWSSIKDAVVIVEFTLS